VDLLEFKLIAKDGNARAGILKLKMPENFLNRKIK